MIKPEKANNNQAPIITQGGLRFGAWNLFGICLLALGYLLFFPTFLHGENISSKVLASRARPLKADVVLEATPIAVRNILAGGTVSALEKPPAEMPPVWQAVIFRVEKILTGDFKIPKDQEVSLWGQMKDAAEEKKILKLLIMDFEKPDEDGTDRSCFSMAVADPQSSFGIREGQDAPRQRFKLSLSLFQKDPASYILVKSEKI